MFTEPPDVWGHETLELHRASMPWQCCIEATMAAMLCSGSDGNFNAPDSTKRRCKLKLFAHAGCAHRPPRRMLCSLPRTPSMAAQPASGLRVEGEGCRVWGSEFGVGIGGVGLRVEGSGSGCRIQGFRFRLQGVKCMVQGLDLENEGAFGCRERGGLWIQAMRGPTGCASAGHTCSACHRIRVQVSGVRLAGVGCQACW